MTTTPDVGKTSHPSSTKTLPVNVTPTDLASHFPSDLSNNPVISRQYYDSAMAASCPHIPWLQLHSPRQKNAVVATVNATGASHCIRSSLERQTN